MQIGGYGVGLKAGGIAVAQTIVVLSRGETKGTPTLSYAVLSNEPQERPRQPHEPILEPIRMFSTVRAGNGAPFEGEIW